jgi:hypothetical protein
MMSAFPKKSSQYFWDIDSTQLDPKKDSRFIIDRLFEWGDLEEIQWLLKTYPKKLLKSELKSCRTLTPKSAAFWAFILNVPLGELRCIQKRSVQSRNSVWQF